MAPVWLKKQEVVARLGFPLERLEFRGQCYDLGPDRYKVCALSHRPQRFLFTLKPLSGKGKVLIGPASFYLLKRYAPELYLQLERGRLWLQLTTDAEARALYQASLTKRLSNTQKKLSNLRIESRKRVYAWRAEHRRGELPETLKTLRVLLGEKPPKNLQDHDAAMLWYEQMILEFEQELLKSKQAADPAVITPAPVQENNPPTGLRKFTPVPEIEF